MKFRICLLSLILFLIFPLLAPAQEYGKMRLLHERAVFVTKQKNDFVARVLASYKIPYEMNARGIVVRINLDGKWLAVTTIEIVPLLRETADHRRQVTAHELYFYTADGILDLISEMTIR
jgi:hypothetical protein